MARFIPTLALKPGPFTHSLVPHLFLDPASALTLYSPDSSLPRNSPSGSCHKLILPLQRSSVLLQKMRFGNRVRIGRLLQLLDCMAGQVCYSYCQSVKDVFMATVTVDNFQLKEQLSLKQDFSIQANVEHVGSSTIEVATDIVQDNRVKASAFFLMACRSSTSFKAVSVPPLDLTPEHKDARFGGRIETAKKRNHQRKQAQIKQGQDPAYPDLLLLHKIMTNQSSDLTPVHETLVSSRLLLHQDTKNKHGKVFGGLLMRLGCETMYMSAKQLYQGRHSDFQPVFIDDVRFLRPVELGSFVDLRSRVIYTQGRLVVVCVQIWAKAQGQAGSQSQKCTELVCCFRESQGGLGVEPVTYEQGLQFVRGKRIVDHVKSCFQ